MCADSARINNFFSGSTSSKVSSARVTDSASGTNTRRMRCGKPRISIVTLSRNMPGTSQSQRVTSS